MTFKFEVIKKSQNSNARLSIITTPHGEIKTPAFIFCATKAAIKAVSVKQLNDCDTQIILSNTYHLMLQPGADTAEKLGGLQKMTGWNKPMLTDSGGFQIFSLGHGSVASEIKGNRNSNNPKTLLKINENGAEFKSYINGSKVFLSPEESIKIQRSLGADFILVLDECTPFHVDKTYTKNSMQMSHRWALRSLDEWKKHDNGKQKLYGIVQGGIYEDLRDESTDFINNNDFYGVAVGGSLGASKTQMYDIVNYSMNKLNTNNRPVHLLGIGGIKDIFNGIKAGIDTFDCVHPTRMARHGGALVKPGIYEAKTEHINLRNSYFKESTKPIEPDCKCETCQNYSTGYIHHLLRAKEILAYTLISIHNIYFMNTLMKEIRKAIENDDLETVHSKWCI